MRGRCYAIDLAEQGPRRSTCSVVIIDHQIDGIRPRTASKYDEIQAHRAEGGRITARGKLVDKSHLSDQPGGSAVAILNPAIIVDNDARLVVAVYTFRHLTTLRNRTGLPLPSRWGLDMVQYTIRLWIRPHGIAKKHQASVR